MAEEEMKMIDLITKKKKQYRSIEKLFIGFVRSEFKKL